MSKKRTRDSLSSSSSSSSSLSTEGVEVTKKNKIGDDEAETKHEIDNNQKFQCVMGCSLVEPQKNNKCMYAYGLTPKEVQKLPYEAALRLFDENYCQEHYDKDGSWEECVSAWCAYCHNYNPAWIQAKSGEECVVDDCSKEGMFGVWFPSDNAVLCQTHVLAALQNGICKGCRLPLNDTQECHNTVIPDRPR